MRRRKRFKKIFLLPPVLLAALFIWLAGAQVKSMNSAGDFLAERRNAEEGSDGRGGELQRPDAGAATGLSGAGAATGLSDAGVVIGPADGQVMGTGDGPAGGQTGILAGGAAETLTGGQTGNPEKEAVTLLFAGDIYLSGHVLNAYDKAGGIAGVLDQALREKIGAADIFMANEEFPFSDRGTAAEDKEYTFRLPPARVSVMQAIGPDIVALANNHAMDYGADALLDTCRILDEAGILHVGAGKNTEEAGALRVIETGGKRIGFLAASRVIPDYSWAAGADHPGMTVTYDPAALLKEIEKAEESCDYLAVYVHWGIERNENPEEYERTLGKKYIDAGADIVVGSHPHVLQGIEYYKGKPIVYSLGNFVFGSVIPKTALLEVKLPLDGTKEASLRLIPCTSAAGYTRELEEEKRSEFFDYMQGLSYGVSVDETGVISPDE